MLMCQRGESLLTTTRPLLKRHIAVPSSSSYHRGVGTFPNRKHATTSTSTTEDTTVQGGLPPWLPSFRYTLPPLTPSCPILFSHPPSSHTLPSTAAAGGLLFGSDIGSSSSVVRILGSEGGMAFGDLSALQLGQIASSSLFGAMVASAALIFVGDKNIGRKMELQAASLLFLIGTLVQSLAPSLPVEYIGRIIFGLGIGTAMHVAPLYIAETSPNALRGKLVSLKEAAIVAGIVLGYGAGALFPGNFRGVWEASLPFEAFMLVGAFFLVPESPRWLALRNRPDEAATALARIQGLNMAQAESQVREMTKMTMNNAKAVVGNEEPVEEASVVQKLQDIFASSTNRRALTIGVGLVLFQQLSGQPSVLYFANRIFESAGLGFEAAVGVGVFKFIMTIVSAALVEDPKWGRR